MPEMNATTAPPNEERHNLLVRVASMYYEDGMTQHEISTRLGYSRSAISRLLTEAHQAGIVEIRVHHPLRRDAETEHRLAERYNLHEVRVLVATAVPYSKMLRRLGEQAARLVEQYVNPESVLGVSWGTSVYEVAHALRPPHYPGVTVLQLIGALGTPDPQIDGPELARWFSHLYGARYLSLPAPLIVDNPAVRDALMSDRHVREVLRRARDVDVAVVGIGTVEDPAMSSLVRAGYLSGEEIVQVAEQGAVGDVCAIHFDIHGSVLDIPLARRVVGVQPDVLQAIPLVLGVAGGMPKAAAILGALRSGLINALVTDSETARRVLDLADETSAEA